MNQLAAAAMAVLVASGVLVAVPGQAAGTAGSLTATPDPFDTGCTVSVNATAASPGNDLTFVIDGDNDSQIGADEHLGTVTSNATTGEGSVTFTPRTIVQPGGGDFTIAVVEEGDSDGVDDTSYPVTSIDDFYDQNDTLTISDGTAPTITNFTTTNPTGTDVAISFNASEPLCAVSATINGTQTGTLDTADFTGTTEGGGFVYNATFFPDGPGQYEVTVTSAVDGAGNDGAGGESASVVAGSAKRTEHEILHTPATVFVGEEGLDLTPVTGSGSVTLVGVSDEADGRLVRTDASSLDATDAAGLRPGGYNLSGGDAMDIHVRDPRITDLTLVLGNASSDIEVTDGTAPPDRVVTVSADYTFDSTGALNVTVTGPSGVDVTPELTSLPQIPSSGGSVQLDFAAADLSTGTYTVTVGDDSLDSSRSATVTIAASETTLSLSRTRVTRGRTVHATAFGDPGETVTVRVHERYLADGITASNASTVFGDTGDVVFRSADGGEYAAVELLLGRDGIATTRIDTDAFEANRSAQVDVVNGGIPTSARSPEDAVPIRIDSRLVSLNDVPETVTIGEEMTVTGSVLHTDGVKAYALVDDAWLPLEGPGNGWATDTVGSSGAFSIDIGTDTVVDRPDRYRVAVVADPRFTVPGVEDGGDESTNADDVLSRPAMAEQTSGSLRVDTVVEGIDAQFARSEIAATGEDAVTLSGQAPGTDELHGYVIDPRGTVTGTTVSVDSGDFAHEFTGFDQRGRHVIFVAAPGRDGTFAGGPPDRTIGSIPTGATPDAALAVLRDRYSGPGVDDHHVERTLRVADPAVSIASVVVTDGRSHAQLSIAGTSNREDGHPITLEVRTAGEPIERYYTSVHQDTPTWNRSIPVAADLDAASIRVTDGDVTDDRRVDLTDDSQPIPETPTQVSLSRDLPGHTTGGGGDGSGPPSPSARRDSDVSDPRTHDTIAKSTPVATPTEPAGIGLAPVVGVGLLAGTLIGWRRIMD